MGDQAIQALLLGRIYFTRYLRTTSQSDLDRVNLEFGNRFTEAKDKLTAAIQNPQRIAWLNESFELTKKLLVTVDDIAGLVAQRNELVLNNLDVIGPKIADLSDQIVKSVDEDRVALGNATRESIASGIQISMVVALLVVALAVGATFLTARLVVRPMIEASRIANSLAEGNLNNEINITSKDETGQLLTAMRSIQGRLNNVIEQEIAQLVSSANQGNLSQRISLSDKQGAYKHLCAGINELVDISEAIVSDSARVMSALSNGDLSQTIDRDYQGSFAELKDNANATTAMLKMVIEENVQEQVDNAKAGNLSGRLDTAGKSGFYLALCDGFNELSETCESILNETSTTLAAMAKGDMSQRISGDYSGAFKKLQQDANATSSMLSKVIEQEIQGLVNAAKNGDLSQRVATEGKAGLFLTLSDGINQLVDVSENIISDVARIMSALAAGELDQKIERDYQGIFNTLKQDANQTSEKLAHAIEHEIQGMIDQAKSGHLDGQIDEQGKTGFYLRLATGINELLRTNNRLVQETGSVFAGLAAGNLNISMSGDYQGDFAKLQENAHTTIEMLKQVIEGDIQTIVDAAKAGDLTERIDLEDKAGFFATLSSSINELVDVNERIINDTNQVAQGLATGDLTQRISNQYQGIFASLKQSINESSENISTTITEIYQAADSVSTASQEISTGNADLSNRTEAQATSLEETTATMKELTEQVTATARRAKDSANLADKAKSIALEGGETVDSAVNAMEQINQSSRKISDIIGVIDEIAFQTNLLALNAAVEAARAGESGRGFSVVAGEVRTLAQRSAQAAKEIKGLIMESAQKVTDGTTLVNHAGDKLQQIVDSVGKVYEAIDVIRTDASSQQNSISQMFEVIDNLNVNTQQNAALVEESSSAAKLMKDQAEQMFNLVNGFKTA